jgi:cytochrome c peroxidase
MTAVFEFGAVSALALFPVLSREEMRAFKGNELAAIADEQRPAIWKALMTRLGKILEYRILFQRAYPGVPFSQMTFVHASNAIAGFMLAELTSNGSPWDRFINGDNGALSEAQLKGAEVFLATQCSTCHRGPAFTGNRFQNVAVAQIGPGQGDGPSGRDDFGRMRVTGNPIERYAFRTTALRNVELTGPWGHDGAFRDLKAFVDHYSESDIKLRAFKATALEPLLQGTLLANAEEILATRDANLNGMVLTPEQVDQITTFLKALTDPRARILRLLIAPLRVPSGLPVDGGLLAR